MQVRNLCKSKAPHGELLGVCDKVRDDTLPQLGVRLEDRPDGESTTCAAVQQLVESCLSALSLSADGGPAVSYSFLLMIMHLYSFMKFRGIL